MNIALFALAAVMIVGGIVSVIQGFPFVRLESGLAMTIAGATTASAGAVLLGLAVIARRLGGLVRAVTATTPHPLPEAGGLEEEPTAPARQRPSLAATAASLGGFAGAGFGADAATRAGREPTFFDPAPPPEPASTQSPISAAPAPIEPLLPNLLPEAETPARDPAGRSEPVFFSPKDHPAEAEMLFESPDKASGMPERPGTETAGRTEAHEPSPAAPAGAQAEPAPVVEPTTVPPSPVETAEFTELPVAPEPVPEPPAVEDVPFVEPEPEPVVVGTYASGGNTYVMYANGVIEAETPRGRYTFASLDELKAFVEAGGETDARGAA